MSMYSLDAVSAFEKLRGDARFAKMSDERMHTLLEAIEKANDVYNDSLGENDYYDDDEAYDSICRAVCGDAEALDAAELVDGYMDINEDYLEALGLIEWE